MAPPFVSPQIIFDFARSISKRAFVFDVVCFLKTNAFCARRRFGHSSLEGEEEDEEDGVADDALKKRDTHTHAKNTCRLEMALCPRIIIINSRRWVL